MSSNIERQAALGEADELISQGRPEQALERLVPLLAREPDDPVLLGLAGRAFNNAGRLAEAADAFRRATAAAPDDPDVVSSLGHVLARSGDRAAAEAAWRSALTIDPCHLRSLRGLAGLLATARRYDAAADLLRKVVDVSPDDVDSWLNLAELLQFLDCQADAEAALRRAEEIAPERAEIPAALGRLLYAGGRVVEAERAYGRALDRDAGCADAAAGRALCLEVMGEVEAGLASLACFLAAEARPGIVDFAAGRLLAAEGRHQEAMAHLEKATGTGDPDWSRNPMPWYAKGAVLEKLGRHDEAFDAWTEANRLKPARFDAEDFCRRVDAIVDWYSASRISTWPKSSPGRPQCRSVFIVGMPRSGTTLVEQVLACHPQVRAGGERLFFETLAARLWRRDGRVSPGDEQEVAELRRRWLEDAGMAEDPARIYTDKFPGNFLHLGLVRRLLPEARVIWVTRHPADTALSIYANDFNRVVVPWATRLEHIATAWEAHQRLMDHWGSTLDLPVITVQYEDLVTSFEQGIRDLLDRLDLPWDRSCLEFYRSDRLANTASFDQVRRPVYATSVGRHRPFMSRLEPFNRRLRR